MRRAAEEKQREEDAEAAKWMNMISVDDTVRLLGDADCMAAPWRAGWGAVGGSAAPGPASDCAAPAVACSERALRAHIHVALTSHPRARG
jgi:hypothetical protein